MFNRLPTEPTGVPIGFPHIDLSEVDGEANFAGSQFIMIDAVAFRCLVRRAERVRVQASSHSFAVSARIPRFAYAVNLIDRLCMGSFGAPSFSGRCCKFPVKPRDMKFNLWHLC